MTGGFQPALYSAEKQDWEASLCGCFSDCSSCCLGFWCPCCLFGKNYESMGMGSCKTGCCFYFLLTFVACQCLMATSLREAMHKQFGLKGSCMSACCASFWCGACTNCQDYREIKFRQSQSQFAQAPTVPPPQQQMAYP